MLWKAGEGCHDSATAQVGFGKRGLQEGSGRQHAERAAAALLPSCLHMTRPPRQKKTNPFLLWEWQEGKWPALTAPSQPARSHVQNAFTVLLLKAAARDISMLRWQWQHTTVYCMYRNVAVLADKQEWAIVFFFSFWTMKDEVKAYFHSLQSKSTWQATERHFFFFLAVNIYLMSKKTDSIFLLF